MGSTISFLALNNYQPLCTLTPENLKEIAEKLTVIELKKGDSVFQQGDKNNDHVFLFKGSVNLVKAGNTLKTIHAGTAEAKTAIAHIIPRNFTCVAASDSALFKIDADILDLMLAWDQTGSFQVNELSGSSDDDDWMTKILQTEAFHRIPPANIQAIFTSLEDINVNPGDSIIRQDDSGDYFYIIKNGRCKVTRKIPGSNKEIKLAELISGDTFGEEALISEATRNASITMLSSGTLSRLSKEDFLKLLNEPMIEKVDYPSATSKVKQGEAAWLDVRLPAEYASAHIKCATHLPLIFLRMKISTLDQSKNYILYCDTERRSSSASYILSEKGFNTSILLNGMKDVPNEDLEGTNI